MDAKPSEIDRGLGEGCDREAFERPGIPTITLVVSILVALVCLRYDYVRARIGVESPESSVVERVDDEPPESWGGVTRVGLLKTG